MSVVVAEGVVEVTGDAKGVPQDVARDIDAGQGAAIGAGARMGASIFKGVLSAWATIGGISAITGFFTNSVTGASDLNETINKSEAIFGSNQSTMMQWSSTAARSLGLSQSKALDAAASFGDMFAQIGFTGTEAAKMSKNVVQAAADLGSFSNLDTADVSERIAAGFRGEYDSLQKVIPNISAARVEQEALAATGKKTTKELTAQDKATAVLSIITKDGARAMGDFAKTSDGAANKGKIISASLEDQQTKLGQTLLPLWRGFQGFLADSVIPTFSAVVGWIGKNADFIGNLALVIGIAGGAYLAISTAMGVYKAFQIASAAATGGLTVAQWLLNAALSANPIGLVVLAIGALVAGIVWIATKTTWFQDIWKGFTDFIGTAWTWLWENALKPVFDALASAWDWLYNVIILPIITGIMLYVGLWAAIFTWLWESVLAPIFKNLGDVFTWIWGTIIEPIIGFVVAYVKVWGAIFTWLWENAISPTFTALAAGFKWVWENGIKPIVDFIGGAITLVGDTISNVFGGIADFIGSAFQAVLGVVRGPINGIIGLVNSVIDGLNTIHVKIPSWVPVVGGQTWGLTIPKLPMLARGSHNAPDSFIAGENGPELVTGAGGARVYSNRETRGLLTGGGAPSIRIDNVTLDARNVKDFMQVVDAIKALPQVARTGRARMGV